MDTPKFDFSKLNKSEQKVYVAMNDSEKVNYERTWIQLETCKQKLNQQKNASQLRAAREKKSLAEKERKERNHRLIERGAILESLIESPLDFNNEEIKTMLGNILSSDSARLQIEQIRAAHNGS